MPLKFSDLLGKPKKLAVVIEEGVDPIHVDYFPKFVTEEFEARLGRLSEGGPESAKNIADTLFPVVKDWDAEDMPYSREALSKTPTEVLSVIMRAILEDARPNPPTAPN